MAHKAICHDVRHLDTHTSLTSCLAARCTRLPLLVPVDRENTSTARCVRACHWILCSSKMTELSHVLILWLTRRCGFAMFFFLHMIMWCCSIPDIPAVTGESLYSHMYSTIQYMTYRSKTKPHMSEPQGAHREKWQNSMIREGLDRGSAYRNPIEP